MIFESIFGKKKSSTPMTDPERVAYLKAHALDCFTPYGSDAPYVWPAKEHLRSLGDIYARVGGKQLGYIQQVSVSGTTATIGHIACDTNFVLQGSTKAIAKAFAVKVNQLYQVDRIVFAERASDFANKGYPQFFTALGATPLPSGPQTKPTQPDYEWLQVNW